MRSQTLRTANSIASNISEGAAKEGAEFARYLGMSVGATNELENHLNSAYEADLIAATTFRRLVDKADLVRRMLIRLIQSIRGGD